MQAEYEKELEREIQETKKHDGPQQPGTDQEDVAQGNRN